MQCIDPVTPQDRADRVQAVSEKSAGRSVTSEMASELIASDIGDLLAIVHRLNIKAGTPPRFVPQ